MIAEGVEPKLKGLLSGREPLEVSEAHPCAAAPSLGPVRVCQVEKVHHGADPRAAPSACDPSSIGLFSTQLL